MGSVSAYFTRKAASSRIESDPFIASTLTEGMAEGGQARDASKQQINEPWISKDEFRRYSTALRETQEFLNRSGIMFDRQRKLEAELETCNERLRRFTGDHARQSESNVENISSTNSPSTLERNYEQFYDHERMDAVDAIENSRIGTTRHKLGEMYDKYVACLIFEESYAAAQALRNSFLQAISLIVTSAPAVGAQYNKAIKKKSTEFHFAIKPSAQKLSSLGQISENSLKMIMKETTENCDTEALVQRTLDALRKHHEDGEFREYSHEFFLNSQLRKYTEKCCKYAWKLVCQTPPYKLEGNLSLKANTIFNAAVHQPCRDFTNSARTSEYLTWVIWPGLFGGSSGRVIRKTEVLL